MLDIRDSLEIAYTLTDVSLPRYMASHEGKGYLTEWVSFNDAGRVTVFDLETGNIEKSITTGFGSEGILVAANKLFVTNNFTNNLVVIDMVSEQVTDTLNVGSSPAGMVTDAEGDVWVICSGGYDENFAPLNDGMLLEINPSDLSVKTEVALDQNVSGKIAANTDGHRLYYFSGNLIYAFDVSETEAPSSALVEESNAMGFYGIGVDKDGLIYAADAKGFAENGEVFRYNPDGTFIDKFAVGRGPNGFSFN
ncbi:MAG: SMP-30/gluconolactonase/LRE family protein [Bacteroidetes bacterium]|nr:SMP-30/gluconolactonase/LRE family protein [Bacteroidota bacterium]